MISHIAQDTIEQEKSTQTPPTFAQVAQVMRKMRLPPMLVQVAQEAQKTPSRYINKLNALADD